MENDKNIIDLGVYKLQPKIVKSQEFNIDQIYLYVPLQSFFNHMVMVLYIKTQYQNQLCFTLINTIVV